MQLAEWAFPYISILQGHSGIYKGHKKGNVILHLVCEQEDTVSTKWNNKLFVFTSMYWKVLLYKIYLHKQALDEVKQFLLFVLILLISIKFLCTVQLLQKGKRHLFLSLAMLNIFGEKRNHW